MSDENVVHLASSTDKVEKLTPVTFSEDAQAKIFVDIQNDTLRYVEENDQWYMHNDHYWEGISKLAVIEAVRQLNRRTAFNISGAENKVKKTLSSRRFAQSVEAYARGDPRCLLGIEELDADPWLLGTPEGVIDLQTGRYIAMGLRPYVTMTTAVAPAEVADEHSCPLFLKFMDEFTCGDKELRRFILQWYGYCLTGDMREQCLVFYHGDGDNGKTVLIQLIRSLLKDYAMNAAVDLFVTTSIGKHATGFADLHRRRCVIANETQEGQTLRMDKIKQITGQDWMRANFMRKDNFEFLPVCKINMFGNHKPTLPDVGKAVRKRLRLVPCNLRLEPERIDRDLGAKLMSEGPGILRALIDGCRDWQKHGLMTPKCVDEQTENYFNAQDTVGKWFEECCEENEDAKITSADAWRSWAVWANDRKLKVGTDEELSEKLEARGFKRVGHVEMPDGKRPRGWKGFRLQEKQGEMPFGSDPRPEPPPHAENPMK